MIRVDIVVSLVLAALWIYCVVEVFTTDPRRMRHLPLAAWGTFVLLVPVLGAVAWLVAGRPRARPVAAYGFEHPSRRPPGIAAASAAQDVEEFRRRVRERAEEQRRRYAESQRREPEVQDPPEDPA